MVDRLRVSSHRLKLNDSIDFYYDIRLLNPQLIVDLYQKDGLSSRQIAKRFNSSKSSVLKILLKEGLDLKVQMQGRSTENYRFHNPPFGCRVHQGQLIEYKKELKVVRLIFELRDLKKMGWTAIADYLNEKFIPTKNKKKWWHVSVHDVYRNWKSRF